MATHDDTWLATELPSPSALASSQERQPQVLEKERERERKGDTLRDWCRVGKGLDILLEVTACLEGRPIPPLPVLPMPALTGGTGAMSGSATPTPHSPRLCDSVPSESYIADVDVT
eukprot:6469122-Amphidinium_carterae.1